MEVERITFYTEQQEPPIAFKDGKIFVEGVETIDPELIGFAVLDFIEQNDGKDIEIIAGSAGVMESVTNLLKHNGQ